jgi:cyclopropane fatty-acyl-phospholipid synthase-like methyltransferase
MANEIGQAMVGAIFFDKNMEVLDFGCGTGLITLRLQPLVKSITGLDTSRGMLEVLQAKIQSNNLANVKIQFLDLEKGEEPVGSFDAIVSSMAFHHVPDSLTLFRRFNSLLNPRGILAIADLDPDGGQFHEDHTGVFHNGFDRALLKELFEKAGFIEVSVQTATEVVKKSADGQTRTFSIFLLTGRKLRV